MVKATFWGQFKAVMWKNMLLKKRNKKQSIQEVLWPIYFVAILAMVKYFVKPQEMERVGSFPDTPLFKADFLQQANYRLLVAPDTADIRNIMSNVTDILLNFANSTATISVEFYTNQSEAEDAYRNNQSLVLAGVLFDENNTLTYSIRFPYDSVPETSLGGLFTIQRNCRKNEDNEGKSKESKCFVREYIERGFSAIQIAIDTALTRHELDDPSWEPPEVKAKLLPKPVFQPDTNYIQIISSIYFVIAYSPFINFLTVNIVAEKEKKIKEGMKMMGLSNTVFWLSWTTIYLVIIVLVTGVVVIIAVAAKFFEHSNIFLFFILLVLYGLSIIAVSFAMTPFFNKAQVAGGLASMGTIIVSLLYLAVSLTRTTDDAGFSVSYSIPVWGRWILCLFSPVAVALGLDQATYLDIRGGMNFDTASKGEFPLYAPILMLLFDVIFYFALAFYLDNVVPGDYGPRHKPWFLFTKSFWFPKSAKHDGSAGTLSTQNLISDGSAFSYGSRNTTEMDANGQPDIEMVPSSMNNRVAVRISNLSKTFPAKGDNKPVRAVDELSLAIYEGQITAILGHNGAGKTTLMNILTGLMGPTSGQASILGLDVANAHDIQRIRQMTGVCPQHNILFDDLTCTEHLQVFAGIKGVPDSDTQKEVRAALESVGLSDQASVLAAKLSGGQKRKLSVAIAIIGDPKIIFLDEPTAGMDPYSRRHLWAVLKEKKKGRVIMLTTHFMDEADILADRKAIVSKGSLRCCGSSLFLKSRFGLGYHLNMVVEPDCDTAKVGDFVSGVVTGSEVNRVHGKEVDVTMPQSGVSQFAALFTELERKTAGQTVAEANGIKSYGVSMTTLEEVFLKLEEAEEATETDDTRKDSGYFNEKDVLIRKNGANSRDVNVDIVNEDPTSSVNCVTGSALAMQRFLALCKIRFFHQWRSKAAMIFQVFLPVALVIAGLVMSKTNSQDQAKQNKAAKSPDPLQILSAYYTNMSILEQTFPYGTVPRLLIRDVANNTGSEELVKGLASVYYMDDKYNETYYSNDSFELLDVSPHYVGFAINQFDVAGLLINSSYTAMYNDSAVHSIPVTINIISNALLTAAKSLAGQVIGNSSLMLSSLPWPQLEVNKDVFNNAAFSSVLIVGMAFALIPGGYGVEIVKDRQEKVRSQLRVSGVPFSIYWGSLFAVHAIKNFIPVFLTIIVVFAVQVESLMPGGAVISFLLICLAYVPANITYSYIISFIFDKWETCQAAQPLIFFMLGYIPYLPVSIVDMTGSESAATALHYVFCAIDPAYVIFGGLYYIDKVYRTAEVYKTKSTDFGEYFKFGNNIVFCYLMLILHVLLAVFLLRLLDIHKTGGDMRDACRVSQSRRRQVTPLRNLDVIQEEDEDVAQERARVDDIKNSATIREGPVAYVDNLRKEFAKEGMSLVTRIFCLCICPFLILSKKFREINTSKKAAVRNAAFAVDAGEVFGLLGPNGAGKTTTLNMMTADIGPDSGQVVIGGHDVRSSLSDAFQAMGYCPQHDALWEIITLREHLECYALVRGIPRAELSRICDYFLENLKLDEHADKRSKKLSGGTKRKLSYCMSMLGRPKIVLLDEPSTGMDPQSKRFLWDTISSSFERSERGAILTTHYMEEADALCSRIAIMINGKIECLGSSTHLKNKYGSGYLLEIKLRTVDTEDDAMLLSRMDRLRDYVLQLFPQATVLEQFSERVQYKVPKSNVVSLARAFTVLEEGKRNHNIEEYSFSQSTLEQVFLEFAKRQLEEGQDEKEQEEERKKAYARSVSVRSNISDGDTRSQNLNDLAAVRL